MRKKHYKEISDNTVKTLNDLLDKNGKINGNITRREDFKNTALYRKIFDNTKQLDVFQNLTVTHRILFLIGLATLTSCERCGALRIYFPTLQKQYSLCKHHNISKKGKKSINSAKKVKKEKLLKAFDENKKLLLSDVDFNNIVDDLSTKKKNYNFDISKQLFNFYHDLLLKTERIEPIDRKHLHIGKRVFIIRNKLTSIPKCKFCKTNDCTYVNAVVGFTENCPKCANEKLVATINENIKTICNEKIDTQKYEIIHTPKTLNHDYLEIRCKKCNKISKWRINNGAIANLQNMFLCKYCEHVNSKPEEQLFEFIKSIINAKIVHKYNSRKIISPYELDIYIPSKNIAFEFNGLYWHSSDKPLKKSENIHLIKTDMCEAKGIQLIHIFEDEWKYNNAIVLSRIKNLLGIYDVTVYARKCEIREVSPVESRKFQNDNHIQGVANAKVHLGLYYDNMLISLMTFGKCRFDKKHEWELLRFCNKLGYHVPGGAGKLLKYFEKTYNPKSLISYADRRWSQGKLYTALGFTLDHISAPNYWYLDHTFDRRLARIKFQKHKLKNILLKFDESLSEQKNMQNNGYSRIYDCGNLVFTKTYL